MNKIRGILRTVPLIPFLEEIVMVNWMEKFERSKDEVREKELNWKLEKLLSLLDEAYRDKDRIKVIENIIKVYDELKVEACDYDYNDYMSKKKELVEIRYKLKKEEYMNSQEAESWNEYKEEEQRKDGEERE